MNSVERVKKICKERGIPISKLERDLGFSNAYISQLKKGTFPAERLTLIADYLNLSPTYLLTGENEKPADQMADGQLDKEDMELLSLIKYLSEDEKARELAYLRSLVNGRDK